MSPRLRAARFALAVFASLAFAGRATATSYVPLADRDLAAQADVIAVAKVVAVEPGPAGQLPATDYLVEVDELVQGDLAGGTVVVRVPGGIGAEGIGLKVDGAPSFVVGEGALLFLARNEDGTLTPLHLMLGVFHARAEGGVLVAAQNLSGAVRVGAAKAAEADSGMQRDLGRFVSWLADRAAGIERSADYWVQVADTRARAQEKEYTHFATSDGVPARWFVFAAGGAAFWKVQSSGMPGVPIDATIAAVRAGIDAWTADPTSTIGYAYDGTTGATGGVTANDSTNGVLFGDPHGTLPGKFDCKKGGAIAVGSAWFWGSTMSYHGKAYHEIFEGDVVVNDGAECLLGPNPAAAAEVFTHELGHTLGFGHATDSRATMWATMHNDGRGAQLGDDDRVGASVVYGDGSFQPPPAGPEPGNAQPFTAAVAGTTQTTVALSWTQSLGGVDSFRIELVGKKGSTRVLATVAGDETGATVGGLKKNQSVTLRVTAMRADGSVAGNSNTLKVRTKK